MALTFPAYDSYDGMSRSISRRASLSYGQPLNYPYGQSPGIYPDQMISSRASDYPHPSYQIYGPPNNVMPPGHRLSGPSYDDLMLRDGYYDDIPRSYGHSRHRRHSTVSFTVPRHGDMDGYYRPGSMHIKFKKKGSFMAGVSLAEAQGHAKLSGNHEYYVQDLHPDRRGTIHLRVKWVGYPSMTYEIPLDTYDTYISLSTLARRVSRACVHYLQANVIPLAWDRVDLHHLEEVSYGVWQPMLSAV